jgi:phenylpyruvate tautomerase PptA (4-oxalocrotonate tautomerase family)
MPLYTCISDERTDEAKRQAIALAITEAHCAHTGAPPEFVHVTFNDYLAESSKSTLRIVGTIRSGRPVEVKSSMHAQIVDEAARILSVSADQVTLVLQEMPAEWAMEGGHVLPAPGTEDEWMRAHWTEHEDATEPEQADSPRSPH